ncbi:MAG: TraR/DksA family transcriptional regulator, partial [Patescibacteria group bacterium]
TRNAETSLSLLLHLQYNKYIMNQGTLNELKSALEKEKETLTEELRSVAHPDKKVKGDWDADYKDLGNDWDDNSQEVTEYATRLPLEHELEVRLSEVNAALEKMAKGSYGICEKCGQAMDIDRLRAEPSARMCVDHK